MDKWKEIKEGPFKADWNSLRQFECPDWFRDAKLGIWSHWGPQAVPMYGDWYAKHMYKEGSDQYLHHLRMYGHPSEHGWKDVIQSWKAEKFDPDALMDLYVKAGAQYFVAQAMHHDNFDNFDSAHQKWNSVNMGPRRDIVGEFRAAAKKRNLPFGLTEHLAASFSWWNPNKGCDEHGPYAGVPYDGGDPDYADLYYDNRSEFELEKEHGVSWYTRNESFHSHWFDRIKDVIDKYKPDLLYSDGPLPFGKYGLGIVAHLYNTSAASHGGVNQAVYNQKDKNPLVYNIGILDMERAVLPDILPSPWQTDTCVGGWFYDVRRRYKSDKQVVEMLVDIVSKNGSLLLNFPQLPDGTLDSECLNILEKMGEWMSVNGEGIYGSRPWVFAQEGETIVKPTHRFDEPELDYTAEDYRFTCKDDCVYAFQLAWPESGKSLIRSFIGKHDRPNDHLNLPLDIKDVELLGWGKVKHEFTTEGLLLTGLPEKSPVEYAPCFKIRLR